MFMPHKKRHITKRYGCFSCSIRTSQNSNHHSIFVKAAFLLAQRKVPGFFDEKLSFVESSEEKGVICVFLFTAKIATVITKDINCG